MKHNILFCIAVCIAAVSCQPHFDMVPPTTGPVVQQEFNENWFVTKDGSGTKSGTDWNNALPFADLLDRISSPSANFSDAGIHIQEGVYLVGDKDKWLTLSTDIRCIRGGYSKTLTYDDLSKCDPDAYPTVFTGDVDGNGSAGEGDGAFAYVTNGTMCFENITFRNFYQGSVQDGELAGKGSAVFGINGESYLNTSVECNNCIFEGNVNGVSGTSGHEGGPCAFVSQGYFKARNCVFKDNSGTSRGGAIRLSGKTGVVFLDRCFFTGNKLTGTTWGTTIQVSEGVICANNCTIVGNTGGGSALNGGGAFFISNCTIIDDSAPNGTNDAAFRCESKQDRNSTIINNVFMNMNSEGYGLIMNSSNAALMSRGYNVIKSVKIADGLSDPTAGEDLVKDIVLTGKIEDNCWTWDIAQVEAELKGYANADDIYDAATAFDPSTYCGIAVLGRAYANWVTPAAFAMDGRGEMRGEDSFQPGSYDPNLDE